MRVPRGPAAVKEERICNRMKSGVAVSSQPKSECLSIRSEYPTYERWERSCCPSVPFSGSEGFLYKVFRTGVLKRKPVRFLQFLLKSLS